MLTLRTIQIHCKFSLMTRCIGNSYQLNERKSIFFSRRTEVNLQMTISNSQSRQKQNFINSLKEELLKCTKTMRDSSQCIYEHQTAINGTLEKLTRILNYLARLVVFILFCSQCVMQSFPMYLIHITLVNSYESFTLRRTQRQRNKFSTIQSI